MDHEEYMRYLCSDIWKHRRDERVRFDEGRCTICCSTDDLEVHHLTYRHVGHEEMAELRTLCHRCHSLVHDIQNKYRLQTIQLKREYIEAVQDAVRPIKRASSESAGELLSNAVEDFLNEIDGTPYFYQIQATPTLAFTMGLDFGFDLDEWEKCLPVTFSDPISISFVKLQEKRLANKKEMDGEEV